MAGETLLLIEDHAITREGLAVVLSRTGYNVAGVSDGKAALEYLLQHPPPHLMVLDMLMPATDYDGWRFLARRRLVPALAAIPVVIATGLSIASDEWAASLGATGLVQKPFDPDTLLAEVRRCLRQNGPPRPLKVAVSGKAELASPAWPPFQALASQRGQAHAASAADWPPRTSP